MRKEYNSFTNQPQKVETEEGKLLLETLDRAKITENDKQKLVNAVQSDGFHEFQKIVLEILTGQTLKEFEANQDQTNKGDN